MFVVHRGAHCAVVAFERHRLHNGDADPDTNTQTHTSLNVQPAKAAPDERDVGSWLGSVEGLPVVWQAGKAYSPLGGCARCVFDREFIGAPVINQLFCV